SRGEDTGTLRGGDLGWQKAHVVEGGRTEGVILSEEESAWLMACWRGAAASPEARSLPRDGGPPPAGPPSRDGTPPRVAGRRRLLGLTSWDGGGGPAGLFEDFKGFE